MSWLFVRHTEIWTTVEFVQPTDFVQARVIAVEAGKDPLHALTFTYRDHTGREQRSVLLDELEKSMRVDARGRLVAKELGLAVLILPLLATAAMVATVMWAP